MIDLVYISGTKKTIIPPNPTMKMPLFTDNSRVYQKPGNYSVGVGSVVNRHIKSRRI